MLARKVWHLRVPGSVNPPSRWQEQCEASEGRGHGVLRGRLGPKSRAPSPARRPDTLSHVHVPDSLVTSEDQ